MRNRTTTGKALIVTIAIALAPISIAQQAHVNLDWNPQRNAEKLIPFGANVISPEVHDDRTVTFRLKAPGAREVLLAGGPLLLALKTDKPIPFAKGADGVWTLTVGPIAPDIYVYKMTIDGVTVPDPNNTVAGVADQPPYSLLVVPGAGPSYYDARYVPHGTVTRHIYHSTMTNGEREMYVYTPPNYDAKKKYPVLYLVGGSGELASNWALEGRVNFMMDNLIADGSAVPMIIAMPNNQMLHRTHPQHVQLTFNLFEQELRKHVIPLVDQRYSTRADRRSRALAGLSMGGRHTQFTGFKCLDLFSSFGVLSAGDVDTERSSAEFLNDPKVNEKLDYLFVGLGTFEKGDKEERSEGLRNALVKHKIKHEYYIGGSGSHDWSTWRHLMWAKFLPGLWR